MAYITWRINLLAPGTYFGCTPISFIDVFHMLTNQLFVAVGSHFFSPLAGLPTKLRRPSRRVREHDAQGIRHVERARRGARPGGLFSDCFTGLRPRTVFLTRDGGRCAPSDAELR